MSGCRLANVADVAVQLACAISTYQCKRIDMGVFHYTVPCDLEVTAPC